MVSAEGILDDCEIILIEFSIETRKWLCIGLYKLPSQNDKYFLDNLSLILNKLTCQFDNIMLMGDFNLTVENKNHKVFMSTFDMKYLIKRPACFQYAKPNCIDLILTNEKQVFKNSNVLGVGISDHLSFIVTAIKSQLIKCNAKIKLYRDYSSFQMEMFKVHLDQNLKCTSSFEYSDFQSTFTRVPHNHAPIKKKILRFNNGSFMTKTLRKAKSKFKNILSKKRANDNWPSYKKQRNFGVNLLRKTKKDYFQNLNIRDLSDNRKFWKTIKPYFTNKGVNSNKFLLKEKGNFVLNEKQLTTIKNSFFINITKSLELKKDNESNANTLEDVPDAFNSYPSIKSITRTV